MHFRPSQPVNRPVRTALCLFAFAFALAIFTATTAHAADYKMLLCAGNNGSNGYDTATNTASPQNPSGIFDFTNACGPAPDPAGNSAYVRIAENQSGGNAGETAYGSISWTAWPWVSIIAGGGYTREPVNFNDGWRGRFWAEGFDGSTNNILMQGSGVQNGSCGGVCWATTPTFASHLWPFGGFGEYRRFVFEMTCFRPSGCDRSGYNAVDANTILLTLRDHQDAQIHATNGSALMSGAWTRGIQPVTWDVSDQGSGLRRERVYVDGAERDTVDDGGGCDLGWTSTTGEFARLFRPCNGGPFSHSFNFDTAALPDGAHTLQVCAQDYSQSVGLNGTAGQSCDQRTILTDNAPPSRPAALAIRSSNPARYLDHFGATFSLPPDPGSPIARVHYLILNGKGEVVVPEQIVGATNPTEVADIRSPAQPGAYRLKLWLEDSVGFQGPAAEVAIPHDTTPPAAPQELHLGGGGARWLEQADVHWTNIVDNGSPIDSARYQLLDSAGEVLDGTHAVSGDNVQAIDNLPTPAQRGHYKLRVWLEDEEGNVGAASTAPLPIDTTPPAAPQRLQVAAPDTPRSSEGFDLRWSDLADDGSPIDAAHYEVLDGSGHVVVPTQTERGRGVSTIAAIQAPDPSGSSTLRLWLEDQEGNSGAPATVPLSYECARSPVGGGAHLDASLSADAVSQGQGASFTGALRQSSGAPVTGAPLCVFEQVEGEDARRYLGLAYTDAAGDYRYAVAPGPNRTLRAVYRPGNRRLVAEAQLKTKVKPTLQARKPVIHNGQVAHLEGQIPGPRNDDVVIVLQVRQGKGWLAFRRYRTRGGGHFEAAYPFHRTTRPTTYEFRAQQRESGGYPYMEGDSDPVALKVLPKTKHLHCAKGRRRGASKQSKSGSSAQRAKRRHLSSLVKRHGKARCALPRASAAKRCARARRALHRRPTARRLRRRAHRTCAGAHRRRHGRHAHHAHRRAR